MGQLRPGPLGHDVPCPMIWRDLELSCSWTIAYDCRLSAFRLITTLLSAFPTLTHSFQDNLGLLPYRRRIVSVVGRPIRCTQNDKPTMDAVTAVQQQYITELMR
jgi:hypothetical protein